MKLRELLAAVRATWWSPVVGLVLGGGLAVGFCWLQTPMYTSSTELFVSTTDSSSPADVYQGSQFSEQRVASYARLLTGHELASRVVDRLGLTMSPDELSTEITAAAVPNTVLLDVSVTDASPLRAQAIAEALGQEFTTLAAQLEGAGSSGSSPVRVTVTDPPQVPSVPSSPKPTQDVILGLVAGAALGVAAAVARARLDRSVRVPEEVEALVGAPLIGTVLRDHGLEKWHTFDRERNSRTSEDFRQLRTNLQFLRIDEPPKVIMVTSAMPSEGKTTLTINLALALADAGQHVAIIEADLRRPRLTAYLGLVGGVGLTNVLAGTAEVDDVLQSYRERMSLIAAGPTPPNPGELLASSHMAALVDKFRGRYDFVLVDAPPLLPVADSAGLAPAMDGVLFSMRYGKSRKEQVREAARTLDRVGARTLGAVLNIVPAKAATASAYGYGSSYGAAGQRR